MITGLSMIELMAIIIIVLVIGSVLYFLYPGNLINLNASTDELSRNIRYTQTLSMTRGERFRLSFSSTGYSLATCSGNLSISLQQDKQHLII